MENTGTKRLKTERLKLRKFRLSDCLYARKWYCDKRVSRFSQGKAQNTFFDLLRFMTHKVYNYYFHRNKDFYYWAVCLDNKMIGFIGLIEADDARYNYNVYYMLSPEYQNNGYTTEALSAVCEYMKTQRCKLLYVSIDTKNLPSLRVAENSGFQYLRTIKDRFRYPDGSVGDAAIYIIEYKKDCT